MYLVVGTYERFLLGYSVDLAAADTQKRCSKAFTHAAHQGPVRCLAAAGSYAVSGGQDDQLHIYDVKHNKDLGFLMNPGEGAVPCVQLYTPPGAHQPTHMFSGSADGSIAVWMAGGGWEHLKLLKGHKGWVNSMAVHPSGRLALSVAHDKALRMWNLVKGRCTYTAPLEEEAQLVAFSPSGQEYCLLTHNSISIQEVNGGLVTRVTPDKRPLCVLQQADTHLLSGHEDGTLRLWDVRSGQQAARVAAHKVRVRALACLTPDAEGTLPVHLASASSDGVVKLWDSRMLSSSGTCQEVASMDTRARITCMAAADTRKAARAPEHGQQQQQQQQVQARRKPKQQQQQQQQQQPGNKQVLPKQRGKRDIGTEDGTATGTAPALQQQQPSKRPRVATTPAVPLAAAAVDGGQQQQPQHQEQELEQQQDLQIPSGTRRQSQQQKRRQHKQHPQAAGDDADALGHPTAAAGRGQHTQQKTPKGQQPQPDALVQQPQQQQPGTSQKPAGSELLVPMVKNTLLMKKRKQQIMQGRKGKDRKSDTPVSWQLAREIIEDGSVEEMAKLGRNTDQLKVYRAFMAKVKEDYASVADFIKVSVLERAVRIDPATNKKQAVDMEHESHQCIWRKNDFPYNFEEGIEHWLLWCTEPLPATVIEEKMLQQFPGKDALYFVNPVQLQSVLAVWHCHVLVRPKGPA